MADAPRGRLTDETASHKISAPTTATDEAMVAACPVPLAEAVADLLSYSDQVDRWLERLKHAWKEGYLRGLEDGMVAGRRQAGDEMAQAWHSAAQQAAAGRPTYAELDRKRYPPAGRRSWLRPGDDAA